MQFKLPTDVGDRLEVVSSRCPPQYLAQLYSTITIERCTVVLRI